jgi:hypothetical protein
MPFEERLFYLSGVDQEESILLLFRTSFMNTKEILFLKKQNHHSRLGR